LLAWCLLDNHVHLLVYCPDGQLSTIMQKLNTRYALHFNLLHGRNGHLFQDRFHSEPVETDEYLMTVVRYIHHNPIKAGLSKTCAYRWSSFQEYLAGKQSAGMTKVIEIFGGQEEFARFHQEPDENPINDRLEGMRQRISTERAIEIANLTLGTDGIANIRALPKRERDESVRALRKAGLTLSQIHRLTGIPTSTLSRA